MTELLLLLAGLTIGVLGTLLLLRNRRTHSTVTPDRPKPESDPIDSDAWELLDQIAEGVLVLDHRLRPVRANAAAARILGVRGQDLPARLPSEEVVAVARRARDQAEEVEELLDLWFPSRSTIKARALPADDSRGVLVVLQDVTEESLSLKIRREFVAHASHELKSPVAGLQTLAEAVTQAADDDPDAVRRFAAKMVSEATRLGRLVSDLLDLSRLEDPTRMPDDPVDLSDAARREAAQVSGYAQTKQMAFEIHIQEDVWVRGDDQQLSLLIRNLLENAIRYTPEGGRVHLTVQRKAETAIIVVRDTGIGIPLQAQGRVFERFYRVDRARSRARGGTGLGLAIVKHVAELHGGEVSLQSELGRGSTFTTRIPALPSKPMAAAAG